jgi:methyl-accepting chemotaxis protein
MFKSMVHTGIRTRLLGGFALICVLLAATVIYTVSVVSDISSRIKEVVEQRAPVAIASTELVGNLYSTLSTLRGYLLTGDAQARRDRAAVWAELDRTAAAVDGMAQGFSSPQNKANWSEARALIAEFRQAQDKAEAAAFTPSAYPASEVLSKEAAPLIAAMFTEVTAMIDEEEKLEATPQRKRLLKTFADVRGNLAAAGSQLRLYVASGETADRDKFEKPLATFRAALASVNTQKDLLTATQQRSYQAIVKANEAFAPLPEKIFAIRRTPQWNAPVFILSSEAAPRAARILDLLDGKKEADGRRAGGIKSDQQSRLAEDSRSVADEVEKLLLLQWVLLAAGLALGTAIAILVARSITRPIVELVADSARLSGGDTSVEFRTAQRGDEIGIVSQAVAKFRDNVIAQQLAAESLAREAEAREAANRNMEDAVEDFRATSRDLLALVDANAGTMRHTAQGLSGIAHEATSQAVSAASASEQTAANVQTVAAAAEQLASSIVEIGRQIELSNTTVRSAGDVTARSEAEIERLAQAAQRISSVVDLIQAIAAQTNLLALNATIEAARAGEAGRGFAVVASEVKALAEQTGHATQEIAQQVAAIQSSTGSAVTSVKEVATAMRRIDEVTAAIASAVEEQGAATREISQNVQMAASGTRTLAANIVTVSGAIEETNRSADQVMGAANQVSGAAESLAAEVQSFFVRLRNGPLGRAAPRA